MVEDVCPLPGAGQNCPFPLLPLAQHGEVAKSLPGVRLETKKLIVSIDAVVGLELLAKTLEDKHMATVLLNYVLFMSSQRRERITLRGEPSLSCVICPTTLILSSNNMNYLTNPLLTSAGPGAPLFMCFLKLILVLTAI